MNTTILKIWFGQISTEIGTPTTGTPASSTPASSAFVLRHLQATIARLFDGRTTGGEVRHY